jgi:predicted enzyme related to lactoylglutathione lyase
MSEPLIGVTLDCADLDRAARFWSAALGFTDRGSDADGQFRTLFAPRRHAGLHHISLQRVPESKSVKNRMHLDLFFPDLDAQVERLFLLGATIVRRDQVPDDQYRTVVMADPDGNEFCVIELPGNG